MRRIRASLAAALCVTAVQVAAPAQAAKLEQQATVTSATATLERLKADDGYRQNLEPLLARARAVLIIPHLVKAGFLLGGEYGEGVLLARGVDGWSQPAFYALIAGSLGLQVGIQDAEVIFVIMSDKALNAIMNNSLKLGADVGVAFLNAGAGLEASTTTNMRADIYAFSHNIGFFGGGALEGAIIKPLGTWNSAYYKKTLTPADILLNRGAANPGADRLRELLGN